MAQLLVLLLRGYHGHVGPLGYFINGVVLFVFLLAWVIDKVEEIKTKYQKKKLVNEYIKQLVDKAGYTLEEATEKSRTYYYGINHKGVR